jgi:hypothetical protein
MTMMRLNDATPADWDRARKKHTAIATTVATHGPSEYPEWFLAVAAKERAYQEALEASTQLGGLEVEATEEEDVVNRPKHYNTGDIECIDAIKESMSSVAYKGYLKGNSLKYLWRYDYKGKQVEDLQKAQWYLNKLTGVVVEENGL